MKVALWAEIRRLAEIEKLSEQWAISRQLCCSRGAQVAAALKLDQPPSCV